jgi:hypothetical protein
MFFGDFGDFSYFSYFGDFGYFSDFGDYYHVRNGHPPRFFSKWIDYYQYLKQ